MVAGLNLPEYELVDTGVFEGGRYFDVFAEYAKQSRTTFTSGSPSRIVLTNQPRSSFSRPSGSAIPGFGVVRTKAALVKPRIWRNKDGRIQTEHETLRADVPVLRRRPTSFSLPKTKQISSACTAPRTTRPFVKDSFHEYIVSGRKTATNPSLRGTKVAPVYRMKLAAGESRIGVSPARVCCRMGWQTAGRSGVFDSRKSETDDFYEHLIGGLNEESKNVARQAACRAALDQTVLSLHREGLADRGSHTSRSHRMSRWNGTQP